MTKKAPLFSIVTPSFNQAEFIEETIKSVIDQSGPFVIEYIIADGGSTDGSVEVIKKYNQLIKDKKYPLKNKGVIYKWWSRPDKGQPDALNKGFKASSGKYVAWVNSDDVYEDGAFTEVIEAIDKNPEAGMFYSNYSEIDCEGKIIRKLRPPTFNLEAEIQGGNIIPSPTVFMKRAALFDSGIINPKYHYAFDYDLWIKIALKHQVVYIDSFWSKFRLHDDSKTVSLEKKFWKEEREISRYYGGRFFSQHYINHLYKYHPRVAPYLHKLARGAMIIRRGQLKLFFKKLVINLKRLILGRWI